MVEYIIPFIVFAFFAATLSGVLKPRSKLSISERDSVRRAFQENEILINEEKEKKNGE